MHRSFLVSALAAALLLCRFHPLLAATLPADVAMNGTFETTNKQGIADHWEQGDPAINKIVAEGNNHFLRVESAAPTAAIASQQIPIDPNWSKITLTARLRAKDLKPGAQAWMTGRIQFLFKNAKGEHVGGWNSLALAADQDWTPGTATVDVPSDAVVLTVECGIWGASGRIDFDDVAVKPTVKELPAGARLDWSEPVPTVLSRTRSRIDLNGDWLFKLATGENAEHPTGAWGIQPVPASVAAPVSRMWYERDVNIPADWADRRIDLDLRRVSTDAKVFINEVAAGEIAWPGGTIDLTKLVKAGQKNTIRILVVAVDDRKEVEDLMGYVSNERREAKLETRGLIGAVSLSSSPRASRVTDIFIRPSWRTKKVLVDFELADVKSAGPIQVSAAIQATDGSPLRTLTATLDAKVAASQTVTTEFDWPAEAKPWDVGQPNLYSWLIDAKSASGMNDQFLVERMGFREFWIDGRDFYLNGTKLFLRPTLLEVDWRSNSAEAAKSALAGGYNFGEIWPNDHSRRGRDQHDDQVIARADMAGLPISGNALSLADFIAADKWDKPAIRSEYQRQLEIELRRWRNSPSVMMWGTSGNVFQNQGDGEPRFMGRRNWSSLQEYAAQARRSKEAFDLIRSIDPTRPLFTHFGAYNGDVYTSNLYLNFIPLQEREEWLSDWAQNGTMPFMAVEFGTPFWSSWTRGRNGFGHSGNAEVFLSEWAASFLGQRAYQIEPPEFRELLVSRFKGGNVQHEYDPVWWFAQKSKIFLESAGFQQVQDLFVKNTWRSWRLLGVSGGMIPWDNGASSAALKEVNGPTLAFIAGAGGLPVEQKAGNSAVTEKTHHYVGGQKVAKQVALFNDSRRPAAYRFEWTSTVSGKINARGEGKGTLGVGEHALTPLEFSAPPVTERADGRLTLHATIDDRLIEDDFAFRLYPPPTQGAGSLTVFDPAGDSTRLLHELGYSTSPWASGVPAAGSTVVVGRCALSGDGHVGQRDLPADLTDFVHAGGRVLVMAQNPDWTRYALQLRVANTVARRCFAVSTMAANAVVAGMDSEDLRDWTGTGTLVNGYPSYPGFEWTLRYGWRWGNRGSVSSAMIEKPHRSSWRPLFEGEFDLAYTPLMEMEFGRGRVILCTFDLEARQGDADPAAQDIARRVVEYARSASITPKSDRAAYLGDEMGEKMLSDLGVLFDRTATPSDGQCLIVGQGADEAAVRSFAERGNRVVVLCQNQPRGLLGVTLTDPVSFHGSSSLPTWSETAGLSVSDLHYRADIESRLLKPTPGLEVGADGLIGRLKLGTGTVIFTQFSPSTVPADDKRYLRFTRWRLTRALCQVLSNAGVTFQQDAAFLKLLYQPDHAWMLSGQWDVQLTVAKPESPIRQWNPDPGISSLARSLVSGNGPQNDWEEKPVPAYLESYGPPGSKWRWTDGECVFRRTIPEVPKRLAGREAVLSLGRVDETEASFVNGQPVGSSTHWILPRAHEMPANILKGGTNIVSVRTWDQGIHGGMCGDPSDLFLRVKGKDIGFYHPDYITDDLDPTAATEAAWTDAVNRRAIADNPYRYYRW